MLLFLPQIILGATLLLLIAGNVFQRGFRSSWLLAASGIGLAAASQIFLRFRLPLSLNSSAWWAGEGLVSSIGFSLDSITWQLALVVCALALAFFLIEVRKAVTEPWLNWAAMIAFALASLLAAISGELLTLAFLWILADATSAFLTLKLGSKNKELPSLAFLPANIIASFLLLAASILPAAGDQGAYLLILLAAALRLDIFAPASDTIALALNQTSLVRLLPKASVIVLLTRSIALSGFPLFVFLVLVLLLSIFNSIQWMQKRDADRIVFVERSFAALALCAAAIGQPGVALAFGLSLMLAASVSTMSENMGKLRSIAVIATVLIFAIFPYLQVVATGTVPFSNWPMLVFLPPHAMLSAGWLKQNSRTQSNELPGEPWMRSIRLLGIFLMPTIFLIFILVFPPALAQESEFLWWPAVGVVLIAAAIAFARRPGQHKFDLPVRWKTLFDQIVSLNWLRRVLAVLLDGLGWVLWVMNRILEGRAGVLWALLLIALLLSVASQIALGG